MNAHPPLFESPQQRAQREESARRFRNLRVAQRQAFFAAFFAGISCLAAIFVLVDVLVEALS